jgi:hypothetical protein
MSDETDELVDRIIETEKQQALQHFRLHPITLGSEIPGRKTVRSHVAGLAHRRYWVSCTAMALLTLTVVFVWHYKKGNSGFGVDSRPIEQTLASISKSQRGPWRVDMSASNYDRSSSDIAWNIQAAVCRLQIQQYASQDLDVAVLKTLSRVNSATGPSTEWGGENLRELDQKIGRLTSTNALENVLAKSRR